MPERDPNRLPTTVVPSHYDLVLAPDLDTASFTGSEAVDVEVTEPVTELVLHALDLDITAAWLTRDGARLEATVSLDEGSETATLALSGTAEPGAWTLHTTFTGVLNDKLVGFYRSTFTDDDGVVRTLATTQFESTHARRAFPCWDEPAFKSTFDITLEVADGLMAISNAAEVADDVIGDGRRRVRFATTMHMSTYLVAFIVGPLEATETVDVDGVPLRVIAPPGKADLTPFALEVGAFSLRFLADWYDIAYPGDKLDLVAIPDFSFGAMENLGCVTFRETALLLDRERSTQAEQQRIADVIAHEIAHMWFGDLVTMGWWNGIWLNEAFATFMEMLTTDAYRPEWARWTDFGLARSAAFDTDSLSTTRAIEYEVLTAADSEGMFDVLTYEKGASVVRMLQQYLGDDRFQAGIRHYLKAHAYGNTETTDLWDAIEEATGEPVRQIMDSWIFRPGHPAISVARTADGAGLAIGQSRFSYLPDAAAGITVPVEEPRSVPVVVRVGHGEETSLHRVLLDGTEATVALDQPADWVVGNHEGNGFYRVELGDDDLAAVGARALSDLSALEALRPRRGRVGPAAGRPGLGRPGPRPAPLARRRDRPVGLAAHRRRPRRPRPRGRRRPPRGPGRPGAGPARPGAPRPRHHQGRRRARAHHRAARHPVRGLGSHRRRRRAARGGPRPLHRPRRRPGGGRRRPRRRRRAGGGRPRRPGGLGRAARACRCGPHPAGPAAPPGRPGRLVRPGAGPAVLRAGPHRRGPHPGRPLPPAPGAGQPPRHRRGLGVRGGPLGRALHPVPVGLGAPPRRRHPRRRRPRARGPDHGVPRRAPGAPGRQGHQPARRADVGHRGPGRPGAGRAGCGAGLTPRW
ncbi:M1 family metallopeptidase [Aquihabitans sp. G128]|nr:M1 family metallopeptidase [Aquihabitans sp. G128]QXC63249.1 M1 family metallopeptidase [Aquihabitans sp. G128]